MSQAVEALKSRLKESETVEGLVHTVAENVEVTTSELKTAVSANPNHPVGKVYANVVAAFEEAPDHLHAVNKVDLQALLDNKAVSVTYVIEKGIKKQHKTVGESLNAALAVADQHL